MFSDRRRTLKYLLILLPTVIVLVGGWGYRWVSDDAFIDFRVVHNILSGYGPVYNPGERIEAYSDPLWVFLLTVFSGLLRFIDVEWWSVLHRCRVLVRGPWHDQSRRTPDLKINLPGWPRVCILRGGCVDVRDIGTGDGSHLRLAGTELVATRTMFLASEQGNHHRRARRLAGLHDSTRHGSIHAFIRRRLVHVADAE